MRDPRRARTTTGGLPGGPDTTPVSGAPAATPDLAGNPGRARVLARLARAGAVATTAALAGVLLLPPPAEGHAGLALTVRDDGRGSVAVDVAWEDGHPVTEPIAATLIATSASGTVGPVPLRRLPGQPTVVYEGELPAGAWEVVVDAALPGIGHCAATVTVGASPGPPAETRCGPSAAVAAPAPPPPAEPRNRTVLLGLGVAVVVAVAAAGGLLLSRRRAG